MTKIEISLIYAAFLLAFFHAMSSVCHANLKQGCTMHTSADVFPVCMSSSDVSALYLQTNSVLSPKGHIESSVTKDRKSQAKIHFVLHECVSRNGLIFFPTHKEKELSVDLTYLSLTLSTIWHRLLTWYCVIYNIFGKVQWEYLCLRSAMMSHRKIKFYK